MKNKILILMLILTAIFNLVWDLISPPIHVYRNLIETDIALFTMVIFYILMWRIADDR